MPREHHRLYRVWVPIVPACQWKQKADLLLFWGAHVGEKGLDCSLKLVFIGLFCCAVIFRLFWKFRFKVIFDVIQAYLKRLKMCNNPIDHIFQLIRVFQIACWLHRLKLFECIYCPINLICDLRQLIQWFQSQHLESVSEWRFKTFSISQISLIADFRPAMDFSILAVDFHDLKEWANFLDVCFFVHI